MAFFTATCINLYWTTRDTPVPELMYGTWVNADMYRDCDMRAVRGACDIEISEAKFEYIHSYETEWRSNECSKTGSNGVNCTIRGQALLYGNEAEERRYETSNFIATLSEDVFYTLDDVDYYLLTIENKVSGETTNYYPKVGDLVLGGECDREYTKTLRLKGNCKGRPLEAYCDDECKANACAELCALDQSEWACNPEI